MTGVIIILLIVLNIPVYKFIFNIIFSGHEDFRESLKYSFTPDLYSLFKGRYWKDQFGEMKLGFFISGCILVIVLEYAIIQWIIGLFT